MKTIYWLVLVIMSSISALGETKASVQKRLPNAANVDETPLQYFNTPIVQAKGRNEEDCKNTLAAEKKKLEGLGAIFFNVYKCDLDSDSGRYIGAIAFTIK